MSASVDHLQERTQIASEYLEGIMPSAITLAMMLRHKKMAAWLRSELEGYQDLEAAPPYRHNLPGHIVAKSPQYGWIPAPVNDQQTQEYGHVDLIDGTRVIEKVCANSKKGDGNRILLDPEDMKVLQKQINLTAELAINVSRDAYSRLLRTVRAAIYLWTTEMLERGLQGEYNHFPAELRTSVTDLDDPERFWRQAMDSVDNLPIPDVKTVGFLDRVFGRAG